MEAGQVETKYTANTFYKTLLHLRELLMWSTNLMKIQITCVYPHELRAGGRNRVPRSKEAEHTKKWVSSPPQFTGVRYCIHRGSRKISLHFLLKYGIGLFEDLLNTFLY